MTKRQNIAVIGGRGMLGSDLVPCLEKAGCRAAALDLPEFDLTRPEHIQTKLAGFDLIVNCAAFTNVDQAEEMPALARQVNAEAVAGLAEWAKRQNVYLLHISTDFVFDGQSDQPYRETDQPNPLSVYGQSKLQGEQLLRQSGCCHAIMRVEWSYGRQGNNFVAKLLARAGQGRELKVVNDQIGSPTWTYDMARAIGCLLRRRAEGLYHFANTGYATRFAAAQFIVRKLGLPNPVIPCSSAEFPLRARRPQNSRFATAKIQQILDYQIRSWQDALNAFLEDKT